MKRFLVAIGMSVLMGVTLFSVHALAAKPDIYGACSGAGGDNAICKGKTESVDGVVKTIVDVLLMVVGLLAVIMLIWGGIQYSTSAGDANKVTKAKNTILYSIIGVVVAILAFGAVQLVVNVVGKTTDSDGSSTVTESGDESSSDSSSDSDSGTASGEE